MEHVADDDGRSGICGAAAGPRRNVDDLLADAHGVVVGHDADVLEIAAAVSLSGRVRQAWFASAGLIANRALCSGV